MSAELRRQIATLRLVCCCEDCANYVPEPDRADPAVPPVRGSCSLLYPNDVHRRAYVFALQDGERVWFCKMFESA